MMPSHDVLECKTRLLESQSTLRSCMTMHVMYLYDFYTGTPRSMNLCDKYGRMHNFYCLNTLSNMQEYTDIEQIRKQYLRALKKKADQEGVFEPFTVDEDAKKYFIPGPNPPEIKEYMYKFRLHTLVQEELEEHDYVSLLDFYVQSVYLIFSKVYDHYRSLMTTKKEGYNRSWGATEVPVWSDLYVRTCLSRVWSETFDIEKVRKTWGSPEQVGMHVFETPKNQYLIPHYQKLCKLADHSLYRVLLSTKIHPHVYMDKHATGQHVPYNSRLHKGINQAPSNGVCTTILLPSVLVNFRIVYQALVYTNFDPNTPCAKIVWPLWGCDQYTPDEDETEQNMFEQHSEEDHTIYPVCDCHLIERLLDKHKHD